MPFISYSPPPSISYEGQKNPTANTCSNILNLPIDCDNYLTFKQNLDISFTFVKSFGLF